MMLVTAQVDLPFHPVVWSGLRAVNTINDIPELVQLLKPIYSLLVWTAGCSVNEVRDQRITDSWRALPGG